MLFSSKVIYDFERSQYVGVLSNTYVIFWDDETIDINSLKKIKFHNRINSIIHSPDNKTVVVFEDGSCELLSSALDSRKKKGNSSEVNFTIENPKITTDGIFCYVRKSKMETNFYYTLIDPDNNMKTFGDLFYFPISRKDDVKLIGSTVITNQEGSSFITIWSDKRVFSRPLSMTDNTSLIGDFHSTIDLISGKHEIAVTTISDKYIAIYACIESEEKSSLFIYNMTYKIIQSRSDFKVFIPYVKSWEAYNHIFISLGQNLKAVEYSLDMDKLSAMIGVQKGNTEGIVDCEMINEDFYYEEGLEFDEDQEPIKGMEFSPNNRYWKHQKKHLSGAKAISSEEEVRSQLNEIYRGDMMIELKRSDEQPQGVIITKLLSNIDEDISNLSEGVEFYCADLEKHGFSEIEITDKIIPLLIKANRTEDIGLILKRYNHISERMLVLIIKYILKCPDDDNEGEKVEDTDSGISSISLKKEELATDKKFGNKNAFLSTKQSETRDVLSIALCCAFDSTTILSFIRNYISFTEMIQLMDHLYRILTVSVLNDNCYDMRGNLVEGDDFDIDTKLFEWFRLLLDSHYQQILLTRDKNLEEKLEKWLILIDTHIEILKDMNTLRPLLSKLARNKSLQLSKKCNQWYTIEKLKLY